MGDDLFGQHQIFFGVFLAFESPAQMFLCRSSDETEISSNCLITALTAAFFEALIFVLNRISVIREVCSHAFSEAVLLSWSSVLSKP